MQRNELHNDGVRVLPSSLRVSTVLAGCIAGFADFLLFGVVFLCVPTPLILGAVIQPYVPRLGHWVLAIGALLVSAYVGVFLAPQTFGVISTLPLYHAPRDIGMVLVFVLSIALVAWIDVALVMHQRDRKTSEAG